MCIRRWLFSVCKWRKRVPQISHGYGFSPVWIRTWARRWATCAKKVTLFFQISFSISLQLTVTQSTHLHKSSATCLTLVWLFSWVNPCVGFEVCWSVELSPADIASIWFLSCSANERRLSKTSNVEAKITFVAVAVYFYRCELFCDWQGFPCSGMLLGNGHICMACRCGPEACGVSRLPPLQTWSRIHYRSMFHFL